MSTLIDNHMMQASKLLLTICIELGGIRTHKGISVECLALPSCVGDNVIIPSNNRI